MIKVLIIEDDPMVREINTRFLERIDGFILTSAVGNIESAQKSVLENQPNLILLDVFLPKENGIDFLKWLRQEAIGTDVILITADKSMERVQEAFRYGAVDYLIKPFSFERFKDALQQFKERYATFNRKEDIEQTTLDRLFLNVSTQEDEGLVKGISRFTYKSICDQIETYEGRYFTAEELSESVKIARVTVRRYLEHLQKEGKLEKLVEYGKVGRPTHRYRKTMT